MSNKQTKMINRIKKAIAPLTPVLLKDIPRPKTVEEGRTNLKRFYGCMDGYLIVLLRNEDRQGTPIEFPTGEWINGEWVYWYSNERHFDIPHDAIYRVINGKSHFLMWVDPDKMTSLSDLYEITKSGCFRGAHDPSFTMNLIMGCQDPILENTAGSYWAMYDLMMECKNQAGVGGDIDSWLYDSSVYRLFSNEDRSLRDYGGFYPYSLDKDFDREWRQMNNLEMRYLHWLLLGPFAPYIFVSGDEEVAA